MAALGAPAVPASVMHAHAGVWVVCGWASLTVYATNAM